MSESGSDGVVHLLEGESIKTGGHQGTRIEEIVNTARTQTLQPIGFDYLLASRNLHHLSRYLAR